MSYTASCLGAAHVQLLEARKAQSKGMNHPFAAAVQDACPPEAVSGSKGQLS